MILEENCLDLFLLINKFEIFQAFIVNDVELSPGPKTLLFDKHVDYIANHGNDQNDYVSCTSSILTDFIYFISNSFIGFILYAVFLHANLPSMALNRIDSDIWNELIRFLFLSTGILYDWVFAYVGHLLGCYCARSNGQCITNRSSVDYRIHKEMPMPILRWNFAVRRSRSTYFVYIERCSGKYISCEIFVVFLRQEEPLFIPLTVLSLFTLQIDCYQWHLNQSILSNLCLDSVHLWRIARDWPWGRS